MSATLLLFYGTLISAILTTGVFVYAKATFQQNKQSQANHSNFGSD